MKKIWNRLLSLRTKNDFLQFVQDAENYGHRLSAALRPASWWKNTAMAIPRITIGIMLLSAQWRLKMGMPVNQLQELLHEHKMTSDWLTMVGPDLLFWLDKVEELALGGLMVSGLNTRLTALSILWTMSERVILSLVHPLASSYLMTVLAIVAGYSLILGSGKLGLDYWIVRFFRKKRSNNEKNQDSLPS
jgi:uncharacterized membrane protein YphA (DoxX/SURF4 family)